MIQSDYAYYAYYALLCTAMHCYALALHPASPIVTLHPHRPASLLVHLDLAGLSVAVRLSRLNKGAKVQLFSLMNKLQLVLGRVFLDLFWTLEGL